MIDTFKEAVPLLYAPNEGGNWKVWCEEPIRLHELDLILIEPRTFHFKQLFSRYQRQISVQVSPKINVYVHSFLFSALFKELHECPRWDCINGWTVEYKES